MGHFNPHMGIATDYGAEMARSPKIVSHPARMARELVGQNVLRIVQERYPDVTLSAAYRKIETATGISLSTLQRIVGAKIGATLDTLADLAHHLGASIQVFTAIQDDSHRASRPSRQLQRRRASGSPAGAD